MVFLPSLTKGCKEIGSIVHKIRHRLSHPIKVIIARIMQVNHTVFHLIECLTVCLWLDAQSLGGPHVGIIDVIEIFFQVYLTLRIQFAAREFPVLIISGIIVKCCNCLVIAETIVRIIIEPRCNR